MYPRNAIVDEHGHWDGDVREDEDMPEPKLPIARLTDPRIMAAQIRAWANVVDLLKRELDAIPNSRYAGERARDLAAQMRSVAAREDNAYPDRTPKPSWEHRGEEK